MARNLRQSNAGHNSSLSFVEYRDRVAELMRQQKDIGVDIKELCSQCDEAGFASKSELRTMARESLKDQEVLKAKLDRLAELRSQLGVFVETPLGEATIQREEQSRRRRRSKAADALDKATVHLKGAREASLAHDPGLAGRVAASMGLSESHNPHDLGTPESADWITGHRNETDERQLSEGAASSPYEDEDLPPAA